MNKNNTKSGSSKTNTAAQNYRGAFGTIFLIAVSSLFTVISVLMSTDGSYRNFFFGATTPEIIAVVAKSYEVAGESAGVILSVLAFVPIVLYAVLGLLSMKFKPMILVAAIVHIIDTFVLVIVLGFTEILPLLIHVLLCVEMLWAFFEGATKRKSAEALEREQANEVAEQSAEDEDLKHYFENR